MITQEELRNALDSCQKAQPSLDFNIEIARFHKNKIQQDVTLVLAERFPFSIADQIVIQLFKLHMLGRVLPQLQRRLLVKQQRKQEREAFRRTRQGMMMWSYDILRIMSGHGSINPEYLKRDPIYVNYEPTWCELGRVIYPNLEDGDEQS